MPEDPTHNIWPPYEAFYIEAMLFSTRSAIDSIRIANRSLDRSNEWEANPELAATDRRVILNQMQNVVFSGAGLSRYFWPARTHELHVRRAERLRSSLDVTDSSPLKNRDLRNLIEHFDERLDLYLRDGIAGHVFPAYIGNRPEKPDIPVHLFRAYYTEVAVFEVLGQRFEIKPLLEEIARLQSALNRCSEKGSRLP